MTVDVKVATYIDACQYALMHACCEPITGGLDAEAATALSGLLKVLADPTRLRILSALATTGELCACDLEEPLDLSQPTVSHHMKQLREAGFVESERRGKWIHHRLVPDRFDEIRDALDMRTTESVP